MKPKVKIGSGLQDNKPQRYCRSLREAFGQHTDTKLYEPADPEWHKAIAWTLAAAIVAVALSYFA